MHSSLLFPSLVLTFSLAALAQPQIKKRLEWAELPVSWEPVNDVWESDNYLIYFCGFQRGVVNNLLDDSKVYLQTALHSTKSAAYKAYFRSADPNRISAILAAIMAGGNITTYDAGSQHPSVVCVNDHDLGLVAEWTACEQDPNLAVIHNLEFGHFLLCPHFFELPPDPERKDCAVANHQGTGLAIRGAVHHAQYVQLVRVLAYIYIQEAKGIVGDTLKGQVGPDAACLALPPDQSVWNAWSYALYAASEF